MRSRAARRLVLAILAWAPAAFVAVTEPAVAGHPGKRGQVVATVAAVPVQTQQVQTQYVTSTPVVAATPVSLTRAPWFRKHGRLVTVQTVAVPATTASLAATASPMVTTSYVVLTSPAVVTTAPVVTSTPSTPVPAGPPGSTFTLTLTGTASTTPGVGASLTQGLVAESVAAGEAPYLMSIPDPFGRGAIAGLLKAALRRFIQSLGPNGTNKDLLKQIATFLLQYAFGGNLAMDWNKALPEIENIISSLLNERGGGGGGGGGGTLPAGSYQIQGTLTIGAGGGGGVQPSPPPPAPNPPAHQGASDAPDRDTAPSRSPFGTGSP